MRLRKTFSAPLPSVRLNRMTGLVGQRMPYQLQRKRALMLTSLWEPGTHAVPHDPSTCCQLLERHTTDVEVRMDSTKSQTSARHRSVLRTQESWVFGGRNMDAVNRYYSNAQDIKDQHSSSTNEVWLALGSAAGRGDMSVVGMSRAMQNLAAIVGGHAALC